MSRRRTKDPVLSTLPGAAIEIPPLVGYLDGEFTLSALQRAVEETLQAPVHKASFRRILHGLGAVKPTRQWRTEGRGRPARFYTWAPMSQRQHDLVAYRLAQWAFQRQAA